MIHHTSATHPAPYRYGGDIQPRRCLTVSPGSMQVKRGYGSLCRMSRTAQGLRTGSYGFQRGYSVKLLLLCPDKATVLCVSRPCGQFAPRPSRTALFSVCHCTGTGAPYVSHLGCHLQPWAPPKVAVPVCLGSFSWVGRTEVSPLLTEGSLVTTVSSFRYCSLSARQDPHPKSAVYPLWNLPHTISL